MSTKIVSEIKELFFEWPPPATFFKLKTKKLNFKPIWKLFEYFRELKNYNFSCKKISVTFS